MVSDVYYGEISRERKLNWKLKDDDPYKVLAWKKEIHTGGSNFLAVADKYFSDKIRVDWGSFAWKGNKESILAFMKNEKCKIENAESLKSGIEYGIVFIEEISDCDID